MLRFSDISDRGLLGRILRLPLRALPPGMSVPILQGPARGLWWRVGASNHGAWLGSYEARTQLAFARYVRRGGVVYDIGAHAGFYTMLAARLVGPSGRVVAFEPLPDSVRDLRYHVTRNRLSNVQVFEAAVAERAGTAQFAAGASSTRGRLSDGGGVTVRLVALDELVGAREIPPPTVLKIDVEGAAVRVLDGARATLATHRPVIFLETHNGEWEGCHDTLRALRYSMTVLDERAGDWLCLPA